MINSYITLNNICFYAYHGVGLQETKVGNEYCISLRLKTDISKAAHSDDVNDTINYAHIVDLLKEEMNIPSKLIEHVSMRIVNRLFENFPTIESIEFKLNKRNPPMGADIESAGIEMTCVR